MDDKIYQFDDYLLDVSQQRLQKNGADISLPPKVFEVLAALLERHGQLVTYQELMDKVWQDTFVEETNLRYSIHTLRKTFPEDFIETVPKRGYRFKAEVADFTAEEFIKKHTGNFKFDDLTEARPKKSVGKYAAIAAVALLMAGIGFAAFYFWQSKPADSKHLKHIAVLPFSVIGESSEKNPEIQKGLADALAFNLEKIRGLKISGGGESDSDAIEIGKKLRADEVLNGTYRIEGNSARINFQLVRVSDGETILAKTFTVSEENRLETENSAALQITRQFEGRIENQKY